jgi:hypothetical protein
MAITGAIRAWGPPKVLLDHKGEHINNLKAILACFSKHFVGVVGTSLMRCENNWMLL